MGTWPQWATPSAGPVATPQTTAGSWQHRPRRTKTNNSPPHTPPPPPSATPGKHRGQWRPKT
eukprot:7880758-Lingulodinium_polyedra.AAC.1